MSFKLVLIIILLICGLCTVTYAELKHGYTDIYVGFDFSTQLVVPDVTDDKCDLCIYHVFMIGTRLYSCENNSLITTIDGVSLSDVAQAPTDNQQYICDAIPSVDDVYVIHTSDGYYAKFVLSENWHVDGIIEYWVQMDGSGNLDHTVPVEKSSWGKIKALFNE